MKKMFFLLLSAFIISNASALPLFDQFQGLEGTVPYVQFAQLPTPLHRCSGLENFLGYSSIYIKRDDLTGSHNLYGGNKVRKLEFLLGQAVREGANKIVTYGCTGTNHGLATACYAHQLGFECLLMLKHQPNTHVVRQNLLLDHYFGADILLYPDNAERKVALEALLEQSHNTYFFPTGGSTPLGAVGYVNAVFELKEQIRRGDMPEPDSIYLPVGSCGTTAGLLLGCVLAGMRSKIIAVGVEPEEEEDEFMNNTQRLFAECNALLHSYSDSVPLVQFPHDQLTINKDFVGEEYGLWIPAGDQATQVLKQTENINVEGTYSAKPVAALIADIKGGVRQSGEVILLWNTYCGLDFSHMTAGIDYKELNPEVHKYFEDIA